jgi:hypothetical protein
LYDLPGVLATDSQAAQASLFESPTTKLAKVCRGFNVFPSSEDIGLGSGSSLSINSTGSSVKSFLVATFNSKF